MTAIPTIAVLTGGLATRLGALTKQVPKALLDVHGRPFLAWQLDLFASSGLTDVVLCVGHYGDQIADWVNSHTPAGLRVRLSVDGERQLGTGGAVLKALPLLGETFLVTYGDSYLRCDYGEVARYFSSRRAAAATGERPSGLMTVYKNQNQFDVSNVLFRDDTIVVYDKANRCPEMQHIDWGLGLLTQEALLPFATDQPLDLAHVYMSMVTSGRLLGFEMHERFYEVGSHAGLEEFRTYIAARTASGR